MASNNNEDIRKNILGTSGLASRALNQVAIIAGNLADVLTGVTDPYDGPPGVGPTPDGEWAPLDGDAEAIDMGSYHSKGLITGASLTSSPGVALLPVLTGTAARTGSVPFGPPPWAQAAQSAVSTSASSSSLPSIHPASISTAQSTWPPQPPSVEVAAPTGPWPGASPPATTTPVNVAAPGAADDDLFAGLEVDPPVPAFPSHLAPALTLSSSPRQSTPVTMTIVLGPERLISLPLPAQQEVQSIQVGSAAELQGTQLQQRQQQQPTAAISTGPELLPSLLDTEGDLLSEFNFGGGSSSSSGRVGTLPPLAAVLPNNSSTAGSRGIDVDDLNGLLPSMVLPTASSGGAPLINSPHSNAHDAHNGASSVANNERGAPEWPTSPLSGAGSAVNASKVPSQPGMVTAFGAAGFGDGMDELVRLAMCRGPEPAAAHSSSEVTVTPASGMRVTSPRSQQLAAGDGFVVAPLPGAPPLVEGRGTSEAVASTSIDLAVGPLSAPAAAAAPSSVSSTSLEATAAGSRALSDFFPPQVSGVGFVSPVDIGSQRVAPSWNVEKEQHQEQHQEKLPSGHRSLAAPDGVPGSVGGLTAAEGAGGDEWGELRWVATTTATFTTEATDGWNAAAARLPGGAAGFTREAGEAAATAEPGRDDQATKDSSPSPSTAVATATTATATAPPGVDIREGWAVSECPVSEGLAEAVEHLVSVSVLTFGQPSFSSEAAGTSGCSHQAPVASDEFATASLVKAEHPQQQPLHLETTFGVAGDLTQRDVASATESAAATAAPTTAGSSWIDRTTAHHIRDALSLLPSPTLPSSCNGSTPSLLTLGNTPETEADVDVDLAAMVMPLRIYPAGSMPPLGLSHERLRRTGVDSAAARRSHGRATAPGSAAVHTGPFTLVEDEDAERYRSAGMRTRPEGSGPRNPLESETADTEGAALAAEGGFEDSPVECATERGPIPGALHDARELDLARLPTQGVGESQQVEMAGMVWGLGPAADLAMGSGSSVTTSSAELLAAETSTATGLVNLAAAEAVMTAQGEAQVMDVTEPEAEMGSALPMHLLLEQAARISVELMPAAAAASTSVLEPMARRAAMAAVSDPIRESVPELVVTSQPQQGFEPAAEAIGKTQAASGARFVVGLITEVTADPVVDTVGEPGMATVAGSTAEAAIMTVTETAAEAVVESVTDQAAEATVEPVTETAVEAVVEQSAKPAVEAVVEPMTEPAAVAIVAPMAELLTEAVVEPVTEPAAKAVVEPMTEPAAEVMIEQLTEPPAEEVIDSVTEPAPDAIIATMTEHTAGALVQPMMEPAAEEVVEPLTELGVEEVVEPMTELGVEEVVEPMTELGVEEVVEPMTELAAEEVVEPMTELGVEEVVEPMMETAVEPLMEPAAEELVEPMMETVFEPMTEPAAEEVVEPMMMETAAEEIVAQMTEPPAEAVAEPLTELAAEAVVVPLREPLTEEFHDPVTEPSMEAVLLPNPEAMVHAMRELSVEIVAEPAAATFAETVVESMGEEMTEPVAEPVAEPVVEPCVETVAEPTEETIVEPVAAAIMDSAAESVGGPMPVPVAEAVVMAEDEDAGTQDAVSELGLVAPGMEIPTTSMAAARCVTEAATTANEAAENTTEVILERLQRDADVDVPLPAAKAGTPGPSDAAAASLHSTYPVVDSLGLRGLVATAGNPESVPPPQLSSPLPPEQRQQEQQEQQNLAAAPVSLGLSSGLGTESTAASTVPFDLSDWLAGGDGYGTAAAAAAAGAAAAVEVVTTAATPPAQVGAPIDTFELFADLDPPQPQQSSLPMASEPMPAPAAPLPHLAGAFRNLQLEFGEPDPEPLAAGGAADAAVQAAASVPELAAKAFSYAGSPVPVTISDSLGPAITTYAVASAIEMEKPALQVAAPSVHASAPPAQDGASGSPSAHVLTSIPSTGRSLYTAVAVAAPEPPQPQPLALSPLQPQLQPPSTLPTALGVSTGPGADVDLLLASYDVTIGHLSGGGSYTAESTAAPHMPAAETAQVLTALTGREVPGPASGPVSPPHIRADTGSDRFQPFEVREERPGQVPGDPRSLDEEGEGRDGDDDQLDLSDVLGDEYAAPLAGPPNTPPPASQGTLPPTSVSTTAPVVAVAVATSAAVATVGYGSASPVSVPMPGGAPTPTLPASLLPGAHHSTTATELAATLSATCPSPTPLSSASPPPPPLPLPSHGSAANVSPHVGGPPPLTSLTSSPVTAAHAAATALGTATATPSVAERHAAALRTAQEGFGDGGVHSTDESRAAGGEGYDDLADLEHWLPSHEVALLRAERAEAALLAGSLSLADVVRGSGTSDTAPSPTALMLSNAKLSISASTTTSPPTAATPSALGTSQAGEPLLQAGPAPDGAAGHGGHATLLDPLAGLLALLADAAQDWNPSGRPDASGAMVGGSVALRLEELHNALPDLTQNWLTSGRPRVVTLSNTIMAVGTSLGVTLVFQLPSTGSIAAAATAAAAAGGGSGSGGGAHPSYGPGSGGVGIQGGGVGTGGGVGSSGAEPGSASGATIVVVGEARSEAEAVTALALSTVTGPGDPLWLLVGHASGAVVVWDLHRKPPKQVAAISGQHDLPVVHVSFFPGRGASMALSADRRGTLLLHTFTHIVLKIAVGSRIVLDGNVGKMGSIASIVHLTPFFAAAATLPTAAFDPSIPAPPAPPPVGSGASGGAAVLAPPGARVGDGMVAICAATGCFIGRFKPSGELIKLYSIPRPASVPSPSIPCAAWLPHQRRSARSPPIAVAVPDVSSVGGGVVTTAVCAVLAVGWHDEVLFIDVPLVGDHNYPTPPSSVSLPPPQLEASSSTSTAPFGATTPQAPQAATEQQAAPGRRSIFRAAVAFTGVARGAATAAVAAGGALPATTDTQNTATLAQRLPLTVTRVWNATSAILAAESRSKSSDSVAVRVAGLHWYDSDALGVILLLGVAMRLVVVDLELVIREQVDCIDTPYISGLMPTTPRGGAPVVPDTLAGSGARVVLLGNSSTLYCSRLLTWQERLRTLADIGKWKLGLRFALDFYKLHLAAAAAAATAAAANSSSAGGLIRPPSVNIGATVDSSYPSALRSWMASLAVGFVKGALGTALRTALAQGLTQLQVDRLPAPVVRQLREATAAAVLACLATGREQLLFDTVFPLCRDARAVGPLVEAVEVAVLAGALPRPAPELVQALVEHLAGGLGRPDRVERCVLYFNIASLDLDQVLRLCEAHQLLSASAAIHNRLHDYKRPLLDMLAAAAGVEPLNAASGPTQLDGHGQKVQGRPALSQSTNAVPAVPPDAERRRRQAAGFKLLVYLRCIFRGQAFPPGAGPLPDVIPGVGRHGTSGSPDDVKAQLLGLLLFLEPRDLSREWQRPLERLPPSLLRGPHPALQVLLSIDVAAAVSVLGGAVAGWDAVETELREAAGKPAVEMDSVLVATQVLVNAFIHLLESEEDSPPRPPGDNLGTKSEEDGATAATSSEVVLDFIVGLLAAGRVVVRPNFALRLLRHVAEKATALLIAAEGEEAASRVEHRVGMSAAVVEGLSAREGQEVLFERLVTAVGVNVEGSRFDPDKLSLEETDVALDLARRACFPRALATLHHLLGDYPAALACHFKLPPRLAGTSGSKATATKHGSKDGGRGTAASAFAYVREFLGTGGGATPAQRAAMYDALLAMAPDLVAADPQAAAQLLLSYYSGEAQAAAFLERLGGNRRLQYDFLTGAVHHREALAQNLVGGVPEAGSDGAIHSSRQPYKSPNSAASVHPASAIVMAALGAWMCQPSVANTYVKLLCEFEPCGVLPFLEQHHEYDVRHCIGLCGAAEVWDAEAYLHERLGDLEAALELHLRNVERCNRELDQAVRSGAVPSCHGGSAASVFFDHLVWLLELSPRLALLMQGSLGRSAAEAAERARMGQRLAHSPSPGPDNAGGTAGSDQRRWQHAAAGVPEEGGAWLAAAAAGGPPLELVRAWEALCRAVAFCTRCFKQQQQQQAQQRGMSKSRLRPNADGGVVSSSPGSCRASSAPSSERNSGSRSGLSSSAGGSEPSNCWCALLHVYVGEVQRRRPQRSGSGSGSGPGAEARGRGGSSGPSFPSSASVDEVAAAALASTGDPVAAVECQERVLRHIFGVFLEEVISRMSDYVPPSEVVRHIIDMYGNQDFGGFRSTLLGLLGSCAYEQAIMCSAQRLISRGVFASHKQRLALVAGCLPQAALRTQRQPEGGVSLAVGAATTAADAGVAVASGSGVGVSAATAATSGAAAAEVAVNAAPFWRLQAECPSGGGISNSPVSQGCSAAGTAAPALSLAPAGDLRGVHSGGQFLAVLQAVELGLGGAARGSSGTVSRARIQVAAGGLGRRPPRSPWRPAGAVVTGSAVSGSSSASGSGTRSRPGAHGTDRSPGPSGDEVASTAGRVGGPGTLMNIDELLNWTRSFTK